MQVLLRVNQQAALRRGINANASTIKLDIDPANLTQTERDVLAAVLIDGHDATRLGIQSEPDEIVGQAWNGTSNYSNGDPTKSLVLEQPDLDGLREAIQRVLSERNEKRKQIIAAREAKQAEARKQMEKVMANQPYESTVWLRADGSETTRDSETLVKATYRKTDTYLGIYYDLSPDDAKKYNAWKDATDAETARARAAASESAKPELARIVAQKKAEAEAKAKAEAEAKAKANAEREAMVARLPDPFRARIEAGYAKSDEVDLAIRRLARADAGLGHDGYKVSRELETLTDEEFASLERVQADIAKRLPDADVEPMEVADKFGGYRKATEDDDQDDIDDDGEVWEDDVNLRRRIVVSWQVAGLTVKAAMPFKPCVAKA